MEFSILGIFLGILLLAVPLLIMYRFSVKFIGKTLIVIVKMMVITCLVGLFLHYVIDFNNMLVNILFVIVMVVATAFSTIVKSRLKLRRLLFPACAGIFWSAIVVGVFFVLLVMGVKNPLDARYLIPVTGLLLGNIIQTNHQALSTYYMGLRHHGQLYYYLRGNGATHNEATAYLMRRAIEKVAATNMTNMPVVTGVSTVILWSMVIAGASVLTAVVSQTLIIIAMFSVSMLSVICTLWFARRYSIDEYGKLKDI